SHGWGFLPGSDGVSSGSGVKVVEWREDDGVSSGSGVKVVEWREEWGRGLSGAWQEIWLGMNSKFQMWGEEGGTIEIVP
nr:hypothetical protein [Tanacetum cinerariifolium]